MKTKTISAFALALFCSLFFSCAGAAKQASMSALESRSFTWKQMQLAYRDIPAASSSEEAIVFVHCWTCDGDFWREQIPALRGRARLLVLDLPGHGRSEKPQIEYSMDLFARAVEATMRHAGVEKATLVGHSMGTPVIRQFYRLFPEKTKALVVVDGSLRPFMTDPQQIETFISRFEGPKALEGMNAMVDSMFPANASLSLRDSVKATMASTPVQVRVSAMRGMMDSRIWSEDRIDVPVLVLNAASPIWTEDYRNFVARIAPDSQYREIPGVGHFLMLENPAAFNAELIRFLEER